MRARLALRKDTLTPLDTDELAAFGGGQSLPNTRQICIEPTMVQLLCYTNPCISNTCT